MNNLQYDEKGSLIFPKEEPEKYNQLMLKKYKMKIETPEHIRWSVEKQHYDNFNSVPKETRQRIIDTFRHGGISIKKVGEKFNIDPMVVADIIYINLECVSMLRNESL